MADNGSNGRVAALAQNPWFAVIGRAAMLLVLPALVWVGTTLVDLKIEVSVMKSTLEARTADKYTATDAARDQKIQENAAKLLQSQKDELQRRIDVLERQLTTPARR